MGSKAKSNFAAHQAGIDASPGPIAAIAAPQYDPTGARLLFSPAAVAQQRLATLQTFERLKARRGAAKASAMVGASVPTLWRWQKAFARRGLRGLYPKPRSGGKESPFVGLRLPAKAVREIERLAASTGSMAAAWRQFAGSPLCPPSVARHVQKHGNAPARLADVARLCPISTQCLISADGQRLFVCLPGGKLIKVGISRFAPMIGNPPKGTQ